MAGSVSDDKAEITVVDHFATAIRGFARYGRCWGCWWFRIRAYNLQGLGVHNTRRKARVGGILRVSAPDEKILPFDQSVSECLLPGLATRVVE